MLGVLYARLLRRPILTWGATVAEAGAQLPGDDLLEVAAGITTRATTIKAPANAVWPWLVQMGPSPRGGAYTYGWIENLLGLDMHSVDHGLPELQHPKVGDTIAFGKNRMCFERVEPDHVLAMRSADGNWVWTFVLKEHAGYTRPSVATASDSHAGARIGMLPMEPGSLVMEWKMLRGIKMCAEQLSHASDGYTAFKMFSGRRPGG